MFEEDTILKNLPIQRAETGQRDLLTLLYKMSEPRLGDSPRRGNLGRNEGNGREPDEGIGELPLREGVRG